MDEFRMQGLAIPLCLAFVASILHATSLGETELMLRDGTSQVDVSFFSSKHTEYSSRERISINFFSFFRRASYRGSSFEYTLVSFFSFLLRFVFEKLQIARRESHLRYELLFQRDEALISRVGREREMPLPDYFSIGRGMGEGGRKRKEKKLTLIPSPPLPLFAEERNDSFTPRHFRFLLSATVLS